MYLVFISHSKNVDNTQAIFCYVTKIFYSMTIKLHKTKCIFGKISVDARYSAHSPAETVVSPDTCRG